VAEDGNTLYFSSDRPGGEGGVDIYRSHKKDGKWTTPHNLGATVNTMGDEFYPFMANDSTLYFSSNGHGGIGGLDIYLTRIRKNVFSTPENLGYPLNTSSDDFSMVLDKGGRSGVFSSNRDGGVGYDDIYRFKVKSFFVVGKTIDRNDSTKIIPDARVNILDESGSILDSTYSDNEGNFHVDLDFDKNYIFSAAKQGYSWIDSLRFSTITRALGRDSLLVPLWSHNLFAKGSVYSNETQAKLPDVTVLIENISDGVVDSITTNATGAYHFLLKPNKKYSIKARKPGFIPRHFELSTAGITNGDLINDFLLEEEFMEKVVIQFDFDKWNLKSSHSAELEEIARIMKRNPKSHIHIGAYADSHGTVEYNLALSNKRANEVVSYFNSHGIDAKRMTAIGFGEELLLNECSNGVICTAEDHSKNRRAELKVQLWKEN
jgi:outer membrane protein OmpA-like peptidoglycan-associated protein